jgi:hypothetical protein
MRFLVDENLPYEIAAILTEHGHEVTYVSDSNLRGAPDQGLWQAAAKQRQVLVTQDLDFPLDIHPYPEGLLILRLLQRWKVPAMAAFFAQRVDQLGDLAGLITVLTPGRIRRRTLGNA